MLFGRWQHCDFNKSDYLESQLKVNYFKLLFFLLPKQKEIKRSRDCVIIQMFHLPLYISLVSQYTERNVCDCVIIFVLIFQSWKINLLYYLHVIIREPIFPNKLNGKTGNLFCRLSKCHHHTIYRVCLVDHDVKRKPTQNNSGIVGSSCQ